MTNDLTPQRLIDAYAKSLAVYEQAEAAFKADPTAETMHNMELALDRFRALREEARRLIRFGDAVESTEALAQSEVAAA